MKRVFRTVWLLALVASMALPGIASASKVTIRFPCWMFTEPGVKDVLYRGIKEFEQENPNITVETTAIPPGEYEDKLLTEIAAGVVPDVFPVFTNMIPKLVSLNILEPIDRYLDASDFKSQLVALQRAAIKNGKTYGVVLTGSPQGLLSNKLLMKKAGITSIPTTPEELFEAAKQVREKTGEFGFAFTTSASEPLFMYIYAMQWVLGFGSDFSSPEGVPTANAPKTIEGIKWLKKFYDADLVPKGIDTITMRRMFWEGKIAFMIDGPWTMTHVKTNNPSLYPYIDFTAPPTPTHAAVTGGAFFTIPRQSKHKDEAWKLIAFFNRPKWQRAWLEELVQMPAQKIEASPDFLKQNPWVKTMVEVAAKHGAGFGYAPPGLEVYANEFRKIVADELVQIWAGNKSVEKAMDDCQKELERWLKIKK